jgi:ATP-binding protein involved in chromosome partitioning
MIIAIPVADGKLCMHFGHCEQFAIVEVDKDTNKLMCVKHLTPPPHEPGLLPKWLYQQGVQVVIAGGMGARAKALFEQAGVEVIVGAPAQSVETLVADYLRGTLKTGANVCDH